MIRSSHMARWSYLAPAAGLVLVTAISACSSSSSSGAPAASATSSAATGSATASASPSATATGAVAEITTNWNTFFSSSTPNSKRVELLQNGSQFASAISSFASSPLAAAVTSKVDSVSLTSATQAKVKYNLQAAGQTVASGATGTAVLQDGTWKVGDDVFCGLLTEAKSAGLSIPVPAACSSAG
jgi:hypothetical protein